MHLRISFACLLLLTSFVAYTQQKIEPPLLKRKIISEIEIFAGINHSWWSADFADGRIPNYDLVYGLGVSSSISKKFKVAASIMLEKKGVAFEYESLVYDNPNNPAIPSAYYRNQGNRLTYITMHIAPSFPIGEKEKLKFSVGPRLSYLTSGETWTKTYKEGRLFSVYRAEIPDDTFDRFDTSLSLSISHEVISGKVYGINLCFESNFGVANILNIERPNINQNSWIRNNSVVFKLVVFKKR